METDRVIMSVVFLSIEDTTVELQLEFWNLSIQFPSRAGAHEKVMDTTSKVTIKRFIAKDKIIYKLHLNYSN